MHINSLERCPADALIAYFAATLATVIVTITLVGCLCMPDRVMSVLRPLDLVTRRTFA